ncbi:putative WRKY transcription factor 7 [Prunus yedoensis var. nudiflora]|uniref:Putative WRKY transcription factor 7 n=1 Tax=Prunus yedoensis var. nudiflora TaxID=2094558 RepID=A0A314UHE3_PRUYE|nr:putative WRKY transcription factor 7 [Prunus yedoensis var. nudiflora]
MAVDFMGYRNSSFSAKLEENAVQEAASGLESVEKLIRLLSQAQQTQHQDKYQERMLDLAATLNELQSEIRNLIRNFAFLILSQFPTSLMISTIEVHRNYMVNHLLW